MTLSGPTGVGGGVFVLRADRRARGVAAGERDLALRPRPCRVGAHHSQPGETTGEIAGENIGEDSGAVAG